MRLSLAALHSLRNHKLRWITAIALAFPVAVIIGWAPIFTWVILIGIVAAVGLCEFLSIVFNKEPLRCSWWVFSVLVAFILPISAYVGGAVTLHAGLLISVFLGFALLLSNHSLKEADFKHLMACSLGWLYIPYLLSYVLLIARLEHPRRWVFFVVAVIVAGDAGAYYSGHILGRHKLSRLISPNKTVEGSIGGLLANILAGALYNLAFMDSSLYRVIIGAALLGVLAQVGDLIESTIKRIHNKKDSGTLLPGHGGVLDRLDSMLFSFPIAWFIKSWIGG